MSTTQKNAWIEIADLQDFKIAALEDGPHWSPDGGYFWAKDGKYYWHNGAVTDSPPWRLFDSGNLSDVEDFSAWSDEKRAQVWAETCRERDEREQSRAKWQAEQDALIESARAKLSEAEFDAVQQSGRDY